MAQFSVTLFENGQLVGVEFADTFFDAVGIKIAHTTADPIESVAEIEEITTFNEDWLGWRDSVDWKAEHEADFMAASPEFGEDVDFAQAQMVAECAEASWYRFCTH